MKSTKDKIVLGSIKLFNENGFVNVTLRDIAKEVSISTGNLSYHYKNKGAILQAAYQRMAQELNGMLGAVQIIPNFKNINEQVLPFFEFQVRYSFFYVDILELTRAYPDLAKTYQAQTQRFLESIKAMIDYNVGTGNLFPERIPQAYDKLAHTIWMMMVFWLPQQKVRGIVQDGRQARDTIWNLIGPYLTEKGRNVYRTAIKA